MLSYQHGYHAGNRADVLKHALLDQVLRDLAAQHHRILYVETHSGRGTYDLTSAQATKAGEALSGVLSLLEGNAPKPLQHWLSDIEARTISNYPGSPALAQSRLPDTARMVLFEKHPAEHKALEAAFPHDDRVLIKQADGYASALKLAPRSGEHMVVFVDPSYETSRDIDALALWTPKALKRWPDATLILWLPLFKDGRETEFGEFLAGLDKSLIAGARWPVAPDSESALEGSAIVAFRAPEASTDRCHRIAASLEYWWRSQEAL